MEVRRRLSGISRRMLLRGGVSMGFYPVRRLLAQSPVTLKIGFLTVLTGYSRLVCGGSRDAGQQEIRRRHQCRVQA
jgi:hypothetical protein